VDALNRALEVTVAVPIDPEYVGALGAALVAGERNQ
jgi:activator of 2-hydroxyglutaryl-CoA dehydratase